MNSKIKLAKKYLDAKKYVLDAGYSWELDWQESVLFEDFTETDFLREIAWVIISSGFRESIVRKIFPDLSKAFLNWSSAKEILLSLNECKSNALKIFGNTKKIEAICQVISSVGTSDFQFIKQNLIERGLEFVKQYPYIGPITGSHLLKNLGVNVIKPDRHLTRITEVTGYDSTYNMCKDISDLVGDSLAVVDLILWRYATIHKEYLKLFENI